MPQCARARPSAVSLQAQHHAKRLIAPSSKRLPSHSEDEPFALGFRFPLAHHEVDKIPQISIYLSRSTVRERWPTTLARRLLAVPPRICSASSTLSVSSKYVPVWEHLKADIHTEGASKRSGAKRRATIGAIAEVDGPAKKKVARFSDGPVVMKVGVRYFSNLLWSMVADYVAASDEDENDPDDMSRIPGKVAVPQQRTIGRSPTKRLHLAKGTATDTVTGAHHQTTTPHTNGSRSLRKSILKNKTPMKQLSSAAEEDAMAKATQEAAEIMEEQAEGIYGPAQVHAFVRATLRQSLHHLLEEV